MDKNSIMIIGMVGIVGIVAMIMSSGGLTGMYNILPRANGVNVIKSFGNDFQENAYGGQPAQIVRNADIQEAAWAIGQKCHQELAYMNNRGAPSYDKTTAECIYEACAEWAQGDAEREWNCNQMAKERGLNSEDYY